VADCLALASRLAGIVAGHAVERGCDCILLSGGVDTSFVALSVVLHGAGPLRGVLLLGGWEDYRHALSVAERLGVRLSALKAGSLEYREAIDYALTALGIADPVEVSGAAAVALGLAAARSLGCDCVLTGDGGDELFLGYTFLLDLDPQRLGEWRSRMAGGGAYFVVDDIAGLLGVRVCHPLYSPEARSLSLEAPLECLLGPGPGGGRYGKLMLRLYLDHHGLRDAAWRGKTPITEGSASLDALEELARGSRPLEGWEPSEAHAYLMHRLRGLGIPHPGPCRDEQRRCPVCGRCLEGSRCRFCGAYLEPGGGVSVYRGSPAR